MKSYQILAPQSGESGHR